MMGLTLLFAGLLVWWFFLGGEEAFGHIPVTARTRAAAGERMQDAINNIGVRADGRTYTLEEFRRSTTRWFDEGIRVTVDFDNSHFQNITDDDIRMAGIHLYNRIEEVYFDLAWMYARTDSVELVKSNGSALNRFRLRPNLQNQRDFPINVYHFISTPHKFLYMELDGIGLYLQSCFFFGRIGGQGNIQGMVLNFGFDENNYEITLALRDSAGNDRGPNQPGRSAVLRIPLSEEFMHTNTTNTAFNAVRYICPDGRDRGILPRSFVYGGNLYVFTNRTGRYRLTHIPDPVINYKTNFLYRRDIEVTGSTYNPYMVCRGSFYLALMNIHRVEQLFHGPITSPPFEDVFCVYQRTALTIGQRLDAFTVVGRGTGNFYPYEPLLRSELFRILAGYIERFGIEVGGFPPVHTATGKPTSAPEYHYWYDAMDFLMRINFVLYREDEYGVHVAGNEYVTVDEAIDILYLLVTARRIGS